VLMSFAALLMGRSLPDRSIGGRLDGTASAGGAVMAHCGEGRTE
jgi:hypothetical protein